MRRADRSKQYPYLMEYLKYVEDSDHWHKNLPPGIVASGFGIGILVALASLPFSNGHDRWGVAILACMTAFSAYFLGVYAIVQTRRARDKDPLVELRREARQVAERLSSCAEKKRLHRDLSLEVSALLEASASNWHRARAALESPYWRRADLPAHLRSVREQSLLAIDQGMQEMMVLFATSVPAKPGNWIFGEVVDEAIGQDVFAVRGKLEHISPFHGEARSVASKLVELADQVESVSRQLAGQELITGAPKPGSALEATLAELKQFERAEDELRQDLRG